MIISLLSFGLTQQEISAKTGVPQPAISRIFTGEQMEVGYTAGKSIEGLYNRMNRNAKRKAEALGHNVTKETLGNQG